MQEETLMEKLKRIEASEAVRRRGWAKMDSHKQNRIILRQWRKEKAAQNRGNGVKRLVQIAGGIVAAGALLVAAKMPMPQESRTLEAPQNGEKYVVQAISAETASVRPWHVIDNAKVYHYCACNKCCGKSVDNPAYGVTRSGTIATAGRTIAVDPEIIPLGAEVVIDGKTYIAEDTGGAIKGYTVDVYCESHAEAVEKGVYQATIKWREGEKQ